MKIKRGDTRNITVTATDAAGDAYDLSSCTCWFGAKSSYALADNSAEIFKISTTSGHIDVTDNVATVHLLPADTSGLPARPVRMYWEFQIKTSAGAIYTLASGSLFVEPDVVKAVS